MMTEATDCNWSDHILCPTVRSRRPSGNRRHPSGNGNGSVSGESTCSSTSSYLPAHHYNTWLPINPPMPMAAAGPVHECSVTTADESLRSYDPTDIHLGGLLAREFDYRRQRGMT